LPKSIFAWPKTFLINLRLAKGLAKGDLKSQIAALSLRKDLLQAISKKHLTPNYGVASLFKMLTYSRICCAFSSARALSLNVICIFEMACSKKRFNDRSNEFLV